MQDLKSSLPPCSGPVSCIACPRPVDPHLEISEIVTRTVRAGGPALVFDRPTRGDMPVAINLFGTERRMAMALGVEPPRRDRRPHRGRWSSRSSRSAGPASATASASCSSSRRCPRSTSKTAPCQEVVYKGDEVDLNRLPGLQVWPDDGGIFHNFGLTHTKHPETGKRNLGLYRLQQHSPQHARHALADPQGLDRAPRRGRAARASGCRSRSPSAPTRWSPTRRAPRCPPTSTSTCSPGSCAASGSRWSTASPCRCRSRRNAQIVLEGYLEPGERLPEGPFGDHTGFYTPVEPFPVLHVECMTMRSEPIYHSIITSKPPQEDGPTSARPPSASSCR